MFNLGESDDPELKDIDLDSIECTIIPIICIENIMSKCIALNSFGSMKDTNLSLMMISDICKAYSKLNGNTLEKKFKDLLNGKLRKCFSNKRESEGIIGKFYYTDCDCEKWGCKCASKVSEKAEKLYTTLPFIKISNDTYIDFTKSIGINLIESNSDTAKDRIQQEYDAISEKLNLHHIAIR